MTIPSPAGFCIELSWFCIELSWFCIELSGFCIEYYFFMFSNIPSGVESHSPNQPPPDNQTRLKKKIHIQDDVLETMLNTSVQSTTIVWPLSEKKIQFFCNTLYFHLGVPGSELSDSPQAVFAIFKNKQIIQFIFYLFVIFVVYAFFYFFILIKKNKNNSNKKIFTSRKIM